MQKETIEDDTKSGSFRFCSDSCITTLNAVRLLESGLVRNHCAFYFFPFKANLRFQTARLNPVWLARFNNTSQNVKEFGQ